MEHFWDLAFAYCEENQDIPLHNFFNNFEKYCNDKNVDEKDREGLLALTKHWILNQIDLVFADAYMNMFNKV